ncbi:mevalonate kinase [Cellulomonas sp. PhB143]|uniref:mevalonate kinase n=1 Tax=Cellulomonas sp. PhB143 TaxID=2485186 RepID=UPI000F474F10|nr:mevalonate kinase [Cellulomonas sp. PhB143]ROS74424.1 mevalonate kinase [Cellulomonas sp. PhB143]
MLADRGAAPRATGRGAHAARPVDEAVGSAHAKVILLGEHAVVHGRPAIALALPHLRVTAEVRRAAGPALLRTEEYVGPIDTVPAALASLATAVRATLERLELPVSGVDVAVRTGIPVGRGLGASAAAAHAIVDALARLTGADLDEEARYRLVQEAERVAHGNPSGLDARATRTRGAMLFRSGTSTRLPVRLGTCLVVADSGVRGATKEAVADVQAFLERDPARATALLDRLATLTTEGAADLADDRRRELGARMSQAHAVLGELGVGHPALDRLVDAAEGAGALGAKLTGGGLGGCVVALVPTPADADRVVGALEAAGAVGTWVVPPLEEDA